MNTRTELEVLIKGLESLQLNSWSKLTHDEQDHVKLCLGTLYWQLKTRYGVDKIEN